MSVENYQKEMITAKTSNSNLDGLTSTSKTSVWRMMLYIMAFSVEQLAQLFTVHRSEIDAKFLNQKSHRLPWIQSLYLNFQYGFELIKEKDLFDNTGATTEEIEASKIIKYCAVNETANEREVIIKIATEKDDVLSPLEIDKIEAIYEYTKRVKGAGVPYTIINYLPDRLKLNIRVFRDPLVINANGMDITSAEYPIPKALQEFMKELPFNGELRIQDLANKLEAVTGVNLVSVDLAQSCWINATTNNYGDWTTIDVRRIPESGYFTIENYNDIRYEV
ncbi:MULTISPECIES: nucleotidyltransferase [Empedobacter]|uniref:nucleotidyltransferase n=1 Tax=Empedobacter TaxID=59734 RepID=UPI0025780444|nr:MULTISPECIES: nucleotidyltransferase [Empedobacter]MDM1042123.1 nucleotidyltransferase [Empedobacter brevis]MDM1136002.1 nucleotidyltransferase [Empedobacter sp. R750]